MPEEQPYIIHFSNFGSLAEGQLVSTQHLNNLPFAVKRIFWIKDVPENKVRGNHAHATTQEILIVLQGEAVIQTETIFGTKEFVLDTSTQGLFIPSGCWVTIKSSENAILLCLASTDYNPDDYILDYEAFKQHILPSE